MTAASPRCRLVRTGSAVSAPPQIELHSRRRRRCGRTEQAPRGLSACARGPLLVESSRVIMPNGHPDRMTSVFVEWTGNARRGRAKLFTAAAGRHGKGVRRRQIEVADALRSDARASHYFPRWPTRRLPVPSTSNDPCSRCRATGAGLKCRHALPGFRAVRRSACDTAPGSDSPCAGTAG